jgi:hypothetical protein
MLDRLRSPPLVRLTAKADSFRTINSARRATLSKRSAFALLPDNRKIGQIQAIRAEIGCSDRINFQ